MVGAKTRRGLVAGLAALSMAACAAPARASVTVGEVAPGVPTSCSANVDWVQLSTPGNNYVMPATGVITSWTHRGQAQMGQMLTLKIFRKIADPARYQVVGHDGPYPVAANSMPTFPANVAVKAGDVLGLTGAGGAVIGCLFPSSGQVGFGWATWLTVDSAISALSTVA